MARRCSVKWRHRWRICTVLASCTARCSPATSCGAPRRAPGRSPTLTALHRSVRPCTPTDTCMLQLLMMTSCTPIDSKDGHIRRRMHLASDWWGYPAPARHNKSGFLACFVLLHVPRSGVRVIRNQVTVICLPWAKHCFQISYCGHSGSRQNWSASSLAYCPPEAATPAGRLPPHVSCHRDIWALGLIA